METNKKNLICILILIAFTTIMAANLKSKITSTTKITKSISLESSDDELASYIHSRSPDTCLHVNFKGNKWRICCVKVEGKFKCQKTLEGTYTE